MTVTYTSEVTTSTGLGCFIKLLKRWRGSIYKIVWADLLLFLGLYYALNIIYLYFLDDHSKTYFEKAVTYCAQYGNLIPLSFVLGFYVNIVYTRWWSQYSSIPFPDNLAILIGASIKGQGDRARIVRRTIVRYVCTTFTLTLTMLSPKVKKRFPTLNHFVEAGLITGEEKKLMEELDKEYPTWAASVTTRARHEGIITEDLSVKGILDELNSFRSKCGGMLDYDWISVPLVYTQVVTLAVYSYFLVTVVGYQFIEHNNAGTVEKIVFSFPFMPSLETLINPFGEDDDDFEVVWMIDRHIQVCFLLVDKIHQEHPRLGKDAYWEETAPNFLPFTVAAQDYIKECPEWSTENMKVKSTDQDFVLPEYVPQADGTVKGRGLWKVVNGMFVRRRKGSRGVALSRVVPHKVNRNNIEEINVYEDTGPNKIEIPPLNRPSPQQYAEEFENLRQERLKKQREKVLKYVELLKQNSEEREKIIDEIIK
ncbi:hypothetical protein NQ318_000513 [Aromia moschata]|uniref:Bestrophin homolog n=1 Tax=Aromia moschata TaxID=1265417 RepID=A0AAV8YH76_9CUCU|nr:hypothetical protein NQ318_000513 [Aromia moschata]